jgi:hypothetical protein
MKVIKIGKYFIIYYDNKIINILTEFEFKKIIKKLNNNEKISKESKCFKKQ